MKDMDSSHVPGRTILSEQWLGILDLLINCEFCLRSLQRVMRIGRMVF